MGPQFYSPNRPNLSSASSPDPLRSALCGFFFFLVVTTISAGAAAIDAAVLVAEPNVLAPKAEAPNNADVAVAPPNPPAPDPKSTVVTLSSARTTGEASPPPPLDFDSCFSISLAVISETAMFASTDSSAVSIASCVSSSISDVPSNSSLEDDGGVSLLRRERSSDSVWARDVADAAPSASPNVEVNSSLSVEAAHLRHDAGERRPTREAVLERPRAELLPLLLDELGPCPPHRRPFWPLLCRLLRPGPHRRRGCSRTIPPSPLSLSPLRRFGVHRRQPEVDAGDLPVERAQDLGPQREGRGVVVYAREEVGVGPPEVVWADVDLG